MLYFSMSQNNDNNYDADHNDLSINFTALCVILQGFFNFSLKL